jgi:hypothetical protein
VQLLVVLTRVLRRALVLAAAAVLFGLPTLAFAATATTVIDPATGGSAWSYRDIQDAAPKYEGGYAMFTTGTTYDVADDPSTAVDESRTGPHGGYNTTTNKCKVCHAVHRAEGA